MTEINISKIKIDENELNIKDTEARNNIISLSTDIKNNYLPLSGGTLTGGLTTSLQLIIKDNRLDSSSSLESNRWFRHFVIKDNNNEDRGHVELYALTTGIQGIQLEASRAVNGTTFYNTIRLGIDSEGNRTIDLQVPEKWRTALGATATGIWPIGLGGTGATTRTLAVKSLFDENVGTNTTHVLSVNSDWSKTGYISLQELRNKMGLGNTTGVLPIANGGTGLNGKETISININGDNISQGTFTAYRWGNIVIVRGHEIKLKIDASSSGTEIGSFTNSRPSNTAYAWGGNASHNGLIRITTEGKIAAFSPLRSVFNINFTVVYFI